MKPKIFISYRRKDSAGYSLAINNRLVQIYGEDSVFKDMEDIKGGENFEQRINSEIAESNIVLVVIGRNWVKEIKDRVEAKKHDYVLYEIGDAINKKKQVIPLLLEDTYMPSANDIPEFINGLKDFTKFNAINITSNNFESDIQKLKKEIDDFIYSQNKPKRILAIDSGQVESGVSLGFLKRIETLLQNRFDNNHFVLSNYFDLIGSTGPSTLIAYYLSIGYSVDKAYQKYESALKRIYPQQGGFFKSIIASFRPLFRAKYSSRQLEAFLHDEFGETRIKDAPFKTHFCSFLYQIGEDKLLSVSNFKNSRSFEELNRSFLIRDILQASFAQPTSFRPHRVVMEMENDLYISGDASPADNPGLNLFSVVTSEGYGVKWSKGDENLFLVAIGRGKSTRKESTSKYKSGSVFSWVTKLIDILIKGTNENNHLLLRLLSNHLNPSSLDTNDTLDIVTEEIQTKSSLLSYVRYDVESDEVENFNIQEFNHFYQIGQKGAEENVLPSHFLAIFDSGTEESQMNEDKNK